MRIKQIQNMWLMIALNWIQPWQISTSKQQNDIQKKNGWEWKPNHMKMKRQYSIVIIPEKHSSSEGWLLYPSSNLSSLLKKNPPPFSWKRSSVFLPLSYHHSFHCASLEDGITIHPPPWQASSTTTCPHISALVGRGPPISKGMKENQINNFLRCF